VVFRKCERGDGGGLLDLFEAQQQLILGKRFGPAAEPMTLHLLDDASPDGFSPPGRRRTSG